MTDMEKRFSDVVENFLKTHEAVGLAAAAINKKGEIVFQNFYGVQDLETKEPINKDTMFGIASLSKSFTALSIMQLIEKGVLSKNDLISKYIPEFDEPFNKEHVTIEHFLTHSGGFTPLRRNFVHELEDEWPEKNIDPVTDAAFLDAGRKAVATQMSERKAPMRQGEYLSYCNDGYGLLSEVVRAKGQENDFEAYCQKYIFKPLEMDRSTQVYNFDYSDNVTTLYEHIDGKLVGNKDFRRYLMCIPGGGSIKSTTDNMLKYVHFYLDLDSHEDILSAFNRKEMMKPRMEYGYHSYYGYGISTQFIDDMRVFGHGGSLPGVSSHILWSYEAELGVVVLCNTRYVPVDYVARLLLRMLHTNNVNLELYDDFYGKSSWSKETMGKAKGQYESGEGVRFEILRDANDENKMHFKQGEEVFPITMVSPFGGVIQKEAGNKVYFELLDTKDFFAVHFGGRVVPKVNK